MPRIQTFVSNQVREEIESLVTERRQEGATESGFNQMEYNKIMLDNIARVRAMCSEIMKMNALSHEVISNGNFDNEVMKRSITKFAEDQVRIFFPEEEMD